MARIEVPDEPMKGIWKPEKAGESREGVYLRLEPPKEGKEKFGAQYVIREKDGNELKLPSHEILSNKMSKIKAGSYVWIEYLGKKGKSFTYKVEYDPDHKPAPGEQSRLNIDAGSPEKAIIDELKGAMGFFPDGIIPETNIAQCILKHVNGNEQAATQTLGRLKDKGLIFWIENTTAKGYRVST